MRRRCRTTVVVGVVGETIAWWKRISARPAIKYYYTTDRLITFLMDRTRERSWRPPRYTARGRRSSHNNNKKLSKEPIIYIYVWALPYNNDPVNVKTAITVVTDHTAGHCSFYWSRVELSVFIIFWVEGRITKLRSVSTGAGRRVLRNVFFLFLFQVKK